MRDLTKIFNAFIGRETDLVHTEFEETDFIQTYFCELARTPDPLVEEMRKAAADNGLAFRFRLQTSADSEGYYDPEAEEQKTTTAGFVDVCIDSTGDLGPALPSRVEGDAYAYYPVRGRVARVDIVTP